MKSVANYMIYLPIVQCENVKFTFIYKVSISQTVYIPVFCLSKYDTAFGNFFSATYSNDCSDADQAKQPNVTEQNN